MYVERYIVSRRNAKGADYMLSLRESYSKSED